MMKIIIKLTLLCFITVFVLGNYTYVLGEEKPRIAVMNLEARNVSAMDSALVSDFLRDELYNTGKFIVLERANMEKIIHEQAFQQTGCTTSECATKLGKLLNVKKVIVGSVGKLGKKYFINVRYVDIETGEMITSAKEVCYAIEKLDASAKKIAYKIAGIRGRTKTVDDDLISSKKVIEEERKSSLAQIHREEQEKQKLAKEELEKKKKEEYLARELAKEELEKKKKEALIAQKLEREELVIKKREALIARRLEREELEKKKKETLIARRLEREELKKQKKEGQVLPGVLTRSFLKEKWIEKTEKNVLHLKNGMMLTSFGAIPILTNVIIPDRYSTGSMGSTIIVGTGIVSFIAGIVILGINIPRSISLKRIGKKNGWVVGMNRNNELMLAYNVYWK